MKSFQQLYEEYNEYITESVIKTRGKDAKGRPKWYQRASRPGYKIVKKNGHALEVKMQPTEQKRRSDAAKKTAMKRKFKIKSSPAKKSTTGLKIKKFKI